MGRIKDLTGRRYGSLTVIKMREERGKHNEIFWVCQCDCGTLIDIRANSLQQGKSTSCGCSRKKHDMTNTRLYRIWLGMKNRCNNPKRKDYSQYGGRGIAICEDWYDFILFQEWAELTGYTDELTLERVDVDGNYEPNNCTWVTLLEQANNKTNTPHVNYNNEIVTLKQLSELTGIKYGTLFRRYNKGERNEQLIRPIDTKKSTRGNNMAKKKKYSNQSKKSMGKIYHKKTEIDGITFDSQTEAEYYLYLKQLQADGHIINFTMQDEWILQDKYLIADGQRIDGSNPDFKRYQKANPGCTVQAIKYISDFKVYHVDGSIQVIDVKGQKTVDFKIKEKMFNYRYPEYNKLYCVVKYKGQWMEYNQAEKEKKAAKKNKK